MNIFKEKKSGFDVDKFLLEKLNNHYEETHKICGLCGITGHRRDMQIYYEGQTFNYSSLGGYGSYNPASYYHNGCYAEKFNKHLCPCKCGKWIDNKKSK